MLLFMEALFIYYKLFSYKRHIKPMFFTVIDGLTGHSNKQAEDVPYAV